MPKRGRASLTYQVESALNDKLRIGESKKDAKDNGTSKDKIFSWDTFKVYLKHDIYFVNYCKKTHGCKTLAECRQYAGEWLESRAHLSACTQKLEVSALAKLYGCDGRDFDVQTKSMCRDDITRSRGEAVRDKGFSEKNNRELIEFCRGTGLRRHELEKLRGGDLRTREQLAEERDRLSRLSKPSADDRKRLAALMEAEAFADTTHFLEVVGKGGRLRFAPIIGDKASEIVAVMRAAAPKKKVWGKINSHADVHSYRADYATAIYTEHARNLEVCKAQPFFNPQHNNGKGKPKGGWDKDSVYRMRGTHKGEWLDKGAMLYASRALGHNRISVVGEHYIRV